MNKLFFAGGTTEEINSLRNSLDKLLTDMVAPQWGGLTSGYITPEQKEEILNAEKMGNMVPLQTLINSMPKYVHNLVFKDYVARGELLEAKLSVYHMKDSFSILLNIALLTPAVLSVWTGYKGYKRFVARSYASIRNALLDIQLLFVDTANDMSNGEYGKMLYLIHNLKNYAASYVPVKNNMRHDFVHELGMIESREFDVAAKRRIINTMLKKYSFLMVK